MSLEDELCKIWHWGIYTTTRLRALDHFRLAVRIYLYERWCDDTNFDGSGTSLRDRCKCTRTVIEQRLLEAISSPYQYVRDWGMLIAKEKEDGKR